MNIRILHIAECAGGVERYLQMLLPRLDFHFRHPKEAEEI